MSQAYDGTFYNQNDGSSISESNDEDGARDNECEQQEPQPIVESHQVVVEASLDVLPIESV